MNRKIITVILVGGAVLLASYFAVGEEYFKHFLMAVFGAIIWSYGIFLFSKNKHDKSERLKPIVEQRVRFNYADYADEHWDDWVWTYIWCYPIVWYMPDLITIIYSVFPTMPAVKEALYLSAGPLSLAATKGMFWVIGKFNI